MTVYVNNITINTGEYFSRDFYLDNVDGTSLNLVGYAASSYIRKHPESLNPTAKFNVGFVDRDNGRIRVSLASTITATIKPGRYVYDVLFTDTENKKSIVIEGNVLATDDITPQCEPIITGLSWQTTVNNPCNPNPWEITSDNLNIKYIIENSQNCGGTCGFTQSGTATATITVGSNDVLMGLDFDGIGETEDAGFERINFLLNNNLIASAESKDLNLGCSSFQPVNKNFIQSPPYLLPAGTTHTLFIDFTTGDPLYHVGCFYEVKLSFN
jgi:hypothetical protein